MSAKNLDKYRMIAYAISEATLKYFFSFLQSRDVSKLIEWIVMHNISLSGVGDPAHCNMLNVSLVFAIKLGKYISTVITVIMRVVNKNSPI